MNSNTEVSGPIQTALKAISHEIYIKSEIEKASRKNIFRKKRKLLYSLEHARQAVKACLLDLKLRRENIFYSHQTNHLPDEDRVVVNEAIRHRLPPEHIQCLLDDYPRACEASGIIDHIDHPIHLACSTYRQITPLLLRASPECASQRDEKGKLPIQLYLESDDPIAISPAELLSTMCYLLELHPLSKMESFLQNDTAKQKMVRTFHLIHMQCTLA